MKQVLLSALLFLLCLSFCLVCLNSVRQTADRSLCLLRRSRFLASQHSFASAVSVLEQAESLWQEKEGFFGAILRHDPLDEVMVGFAALRQYLLLQDLDDFMASSSELAAAIEHLQQMERPLLQNIL